MAKYKVSYKVLGKEAEELKAVAKLLDGYAERVSQIQGRLGQDEALAAVRNNLQKLGAQLGEARAVLDTAGQILAKSVENYTGAETRQVRKVDSLKAHNRDFYKNPVAVASAGGAAAVSPPAGVTVNSTTINYNVGPDMAAAGTGAGNVGVAGGLGAMAGAGAAMGALHLKKRREEENADKAEKPVADTPEVQLEKALERARSLAKKD
mgnify:CR=1 FL=1